MKKIAIVLLLFGIASLASCGTLQEYLALPGLTPQPSPMATRVQDTQTPEPTSTPTVDSIATLAIMGTQLSSAQEAERLAQLEIDNLNRKMIEATSAHDAGLLQIAFITQEVYETSVSGTQAAAVLTSTAYPTAAFLQSEMIRLEEKRIEARKAEPTLNWAIANSEHADERIANELFLKWVIVAFVILCCVFLMVHIVRMVFQMPLTPTEPHQIENLGESEKQKPSDAQYVPAYERNGATVERRIYPKIPCSLPVFLMLAEGIVKSGMTLATKQWEGTPVHKEIMELRAWAVGNKFASPLTGKGGELVITENFDRCGRFFFEDTVELREPPAPYYCEEEEKGELI